ncbi:ETS domain-containing protein [Endozoicomonas sp. YOMI1]|uniref:erythroblast transformation specific domain-containing protein n=1 Tax=Endozoicomonas sp. YOMI1 TaxID=2828739 RepID=UPI0021480055|nr:ETS domain-containing protein [Endozoicomonas sp. YOMI1]
MSNPVSANSQTVTKFNKVYSNINGQLYGRSSTTRSNKEKPLRYAPYTTTHQILTNSPLNSRQNQTALSQRQMKINYQRFNHLNVPHGVQSISNDYPGIMNDFFETMHPYFTEAGIMTQPLAYKESNKSTYSSVLTNDKNTQDTYETPDPDSSGKNLILQNQKKNDLSIFTENRATAHSDNRFTSTVPDIFLDSSRQSGAVADYYTAIEKNLETQVAEHSNVKPEFSEPAKNVLPFTYTHYTPTASTSQMESNPSLNLHQLSKPRYVLINKEKPLWHFILDNLNSNQNQDNPVRWVDQKQGIFEFKNPLKFSQAWSNHKKRTTTIIFENISRAIRFYYDNKLITKVDQHGLRLPNMQYRFNLSHPVIVDYFVTFATTDVP